MTTSYTRYIQYVDKNGSQKCFIEILDSPKSNSVRNVCAHLHIYTYSMKEKRLLKCHLIMTIQIHNKISPNYLLLYFRKHQNNLCILQPFFITAIRNKYVQILHYEFNTHIKKVFYFTYKLSHFNALSPFLSPLHLYNRNCEITSLNICNTSVTIKQSLYFKLIMNLQSVL